MNRLAASVEKMVAVSLKKTRIDSEKWLGSFSSMIFSVKKVVQMEIYTSFGEF